MIGEVYMEVKIPLVLAKIVDLGVEMSNMGAVVKYGRRLVPYALFALASGVASAVCASSAARTAVSACSACAACCAARCC